MKVALFVPCYIDQFYPQVAIATLQLLRKLEITVDFPREQTCCGQPIANAGYEHYTAATVRNFCESFSGYDYIVGPSGSCVFHVKHHFHGEANKAGIEQIQKNIYELSEFLTDVLKVEKIDAQFPEKVGLHQSCHGLRGLRLGNSSEQVVAQYSKTRRLLEMVEGLQLVDLDRPDECCGFGGTFAVSQAAMSTRIGEDRIADHQRNGAAVITATDMSCLMHLDGLLRRQKSNIRVMHFAEILNGATS